MAFGFTPKFEQSLELNGLDPKHYLTIALAAVKKLDSNLNYTSKSGFIAYIGSGVFSSTEEFKVIIQPDVVHIISTQLSSGMYDWGRNKKHVEEFIQVFDEIQTATSEEQLNEMVAELDPVFESTDEDQLALPPPTTSDNIKAFFLFFVPREGFFVTPIIIDTNILVFILMALTGVSIIEPGNEEILNWGANFRELTLEGQWWRLLTNVFLHIGIFHLLLNMYALLYIGILLEPYLGKLRFAAAYFFTGIIASLTSIYWHPFTISAGASGAIFGMYGVFLAMLTTNFINKAARKPLLISIGVFVMLNLMNGAKAGIDNAAHVGGLLTGILIGYIYYPSLKRPAQFGLKYNTVMLLSVAFVVSSIFIYKAIPNDVVKYDTKIKEFSEQEAKALEFFKLPVNAPKYMLLAAVDDGINNWNAGLNIINEIDKLDVPRELLVRDNNLKKYCRLRIKCYGFIRKAISENTTQYEDSVRNCNQQIEAVLNDLKGK